MGALLDDDGESMISQLSLPCRSATVIPVWLIRHISLLISPVLADLIGRRQEPDG